MQFFENGPSIPDELLTARDEGRVVLFCGAGVSQARAGLPNFFGLVEKVIRHLRISDDCEAFRLYQKAKQDITDSNKTEISADRIFGLLERDEFSKNEIETSVVKTLKTKTDVDLSAHKILLDIATTQEGKVRLVTTNFDRLFDKCDNKVNVWKSPRLPDPASQSELDGIIYLHGCTDKRYTKPEGEGFILTSSDFGRAYLVDGWATSFFKEIIDKYIVVFIGYSADDPPVNYLLEALHKKNGRPHKMYAFQGGENDFAISKWRHKGVNAIAYNEENGHRALWEALEAWAERARSPQNWHKKTIELARQLPEKLKPYQRGQVAHVVSTIGGARAFAASNPPPLADWLCVFDPQIRYAKRYRNPFRNSSFTSDPFIDPFTLYGIDSDPQPPPPEAFDHLKERVIPAGLWNAFENTRIDIQNLSDENISAFKGHFAVNIPMLPKRLIEFANWISEVMESPVTVWWAARQNGLHPFIIQRILMNINTMQLPAAIRTSWLLLCETWKRTVDTTDFFFNRNIVKRIENEEIDEQTLRRCIEFKEPFLKINGSYQIKPGLLNIDRGINPNDLFLIEVDYPDLENLEIIPDVWLQFAIPALRKNIEHALQLEKEINNPLYFRSSINEDKKPGIEQLNRTRGLDGYVLSFTELFERLIKYNVKQARSEFNKWIDYDDAVFSRLKIWGCGIKELVPIEDVARIIKNLSDQAFWAKHHQRDLLITLSQRWNEFSNNLKNEIEHKLLQGRITKWEHEEEKEFEQRTALQILDRISWLSTKGCEFSFNIEPIADQLKDRAGNNTHSLCSNAADSMEEGVYWTKTNTDHSPLLHIPIDTIIDKASDLSRTNVTVTTECDPFKGLSVKRPKLAFSALTAKARRNEFPEWAWDTFLTEQSRKEDKPKFMALIAERLVSYPEQSVVNILGPVSEWLLNVSETLSNYYQKSFERIVDKILQLLSTLPQNTDINVSVFHTSSFDFQMKALNSPAGKMVKSILKDTRVKNTKQPGCFPAWARDSYSKLLLLNSTYRQDAIVMLASRLNGLYFHCPEWTEANLISLLNDNTKADYEAFWEGFLWGGAKVSQPLFKLIKKELLKLTTSNKKIDQSFFRILSNTILSGWITRECNTKERLVSEEEMRTFLLLTNDEIRENTLSSIEFRIKHIRTAEGMDFQDIKYFLQNIWPRQKYTKSESISAEFIRIATMDKRYFDKLIKIILPMLIPLSDAKHLPVTIRIKEGGLIERNPRPIFELYYKILPEEVKSWPYDTGEILQKICEADKKLSTDNRMIELQRKWNAR